MVGFFGLLLQFRCQGRAWRAPLSLLILAGLAASAWTHPTYTPTNTGTPTPTPTATNTGTPTATPTPTPTPRHLKLLVPQGFKTIQDAIDFAVDGDRVVV